MSYRTLSSIYKGKWLIEKAFAESQLPIIAEILTGKNASFQTRPNAFDDDGGSGEEPKLLVAVHMTEAGSVASRYRKYDEAPAGSLAVISITGPILKYGGDCGEPGSIHYTSWVKDAKSSKNIAGVIFKVDSPGGMVDGTATLADEIKNLGKPTIGFVDDGMAASAAMWIISSCDEIFVSQTTDMVGSIGVFSTLFDYSGWFEKNGYKMHQIYAPQSTEKNLDYKEALKGNYKLIEGELKFICEQFISTIQTNRAGKLNSSAGDPFKGAMYFAEQAIAIGLIDGVKSFDQVVNHLSSKVSTNNSSKSATSTSTNMFDKNFKKVSALKGKAASDITAEELQAANAELIVEGVSSVVLITTEQVTKNADLVNQLNAATEKNTELAGQITTLQSEIAALGKQPGEKPTTAVKVVEEAEAAKAEGPVFADYPHNKKALSELDGL